MNESLDFPAAHSMDSGWFAVDRGGELAHFDTGEAGALLLNTPYKTGESMTGESDELYLRHIAPWIARHVAAHEFDGMTYGSLVAIFEDGESARMFARTSDEVGLVVGYAERLSMRQNSEALRVALSEAPGFTGLAPSSLSDLLYEFEDLSAPIARYGHGDWEVPGHYVRVAEAAAPSHLDLLPSMPQFDVVFAQADSIQFAEVATEAHDFESWGDAPLEGFPPTTTVLPKPGFWSWLSTQFKKK